ncbi:MAG: CBS domain-containing protein [Bacteriovoracaceae bacterium]|jgi:CBS domain-containing protein|nr:CBS domain-containing protein [Bacteriovoracaceae bacterium]
MDDLIDDELKIMEEREEEDSQTLNMQTFKEPISELRMPAVKAVEESTTIEAAIKIMQENHFGSLIIIKNGKLSGIVTERDILMKACLKIDNWSKTPVSQIMTADPVSLQATDMIAHVLHNMHVGGFRHIPIVNESGEPISLVSIKDIVSFVIEHFPPEIINVVSHPFRGKSIREGA